MLQHVWSPVLGNTTVVCLGWNVTTCTAGFPQRVQYKLAVTLHRSLQHQAPWYLSDYCVPVSEVPGRQHLWSARCHQLSVPRVRRSTLGTFAFSIARSTACNSLPDHLCDPAVVSLNNLVGTCRRIYSPDIWSVSTLEVLYVIALYKSTFTYLLNLLEPFNHFIAMMSLFCSQ